MTIQGSLYTTPKMTKTQASGSLNPVSESRTRVHNVNPPKFTSESLQHVPDGPDMLNTWVKNQETSTVYERVQQKASDFCSIMGGSKQP